LEAPPKNINNFPYLTKGKVNGCLKSIGLEKNLEIFYGKRKKQLIFLTAFYIFHKSGVKNFLKWFINNFPKGTR